MTNLLDLPAEILNQICEQLCYHCRNPRHFVNADEEESVEDKRALAKLCRTSRILLNLGQSVLYHYYATGNLAPVVDNGIERHSMPRRMPDDDKLALFLRTIIERPDLNQMVRSLQLVHNEQSMPVTGELYTLLKSHVVQTGQLPEPLEDTSMYSCGRREVWMQGAQTTATTTTMTTTTTTATASTAMEASTELNWFGTCFHNRDALRGWIQAITILKTAESLESLCVAADGERCPCVVSGFKLPRLKRMLLRGGGFGGAHMPEWLKLRSFASDVEELYIDFAPGSGWVPLANQNPMANLKKLFIVGLDPDSLEVLLSNCPALEGLEYYFPNPVWDWYPSEYNTALKQVKTTLRRLCFVRIPSTGNQDLRCILEDDDQCCFALQERLTYDPIASFEDFEVLQYLTLDQQSFYRPSQPSSSILWFLPPNIKHFQILYTFYNMRDKLAALAHSVRHGSFSCLQTLRLSLRHRVSYDRTHTFEWIHESRAVLQEAGVQFIHEVRRDWHSYDESLNGSGRDLRGCEPLTIIPGATAGSRYVACGWTESWKWCDHKKWGEPTGFEECYEGYEDQQHFDCEFHLLQTGESWSASRCCDDIAVVDDSE